MFLSPLLRTRLSVPVVGINPDRYRAVIDKIDLHIRPKLSMFHCSKPLRGHFLEKRLIGIHRQRRFCRTDKAGTAAPGGISVKGKIAHHQRRISQLRRAAVEFALLILKDAQMRTFFGQFRDNVKSVGVPDAQQNHNASADGAGFSPVHRHRCAGDPLNYRSHKNLHPYRAAVQAAGTGTRK